RHRQRGRVLLQRGVRLRDRPDPVRPRRTLAAIVAPAHLVCLTFDFDAVSSWIFRGETSPTALSRGAFGGVGARRLLTLLRRRGLRATWFIPGHTIETYPDACAAVHAAGHEIGHHGYLHEPPATLDREAEAAVLDRGIECIRALTGAAPAGY